MPAHDVEYVLPLRWHDDHDLEDLTTYLADLSRGVDVTVVDGSAPQLFRRHAQEWAGLVRHLPPSPGRDATARCATS